jgi:hypothetical protein
MGRVNQKGYPLRFDKKSKAFCIKSAVPPDNIPMTTGGERHISGTGNKNTVSGAGQSIGDRSGFTCTAKQKNHRR